MAMCPGHGRAAEVHHAALAALEEVKAANAERLSQARQRVDDSRAELAQVIVKSYLGGERVGVVAAHRLHTRHHPRDSPCGWRRTRLAIVAVHPARPGCALWGGSRPGHWLALVCRTVLTAPIPALPCGSRHERALDRKQRTSHRAATRRTATFLTAASAACPADSGLLWHIAARIRVVDGRWSTALS